MNPQSSQVTRAAEYIRVSTDRQIDSEERQQRVIRDYAAGHGITIVRTFADIGKSGLNLKNRPAFFKLLAEIEKSKYPDFEVILVYDISRWGRFQNTDESAFCEFICTRAGVRVVYCTEPFENAATPIAAVYKTIKRTIAAEYSREQSERISRALNRAANLGHSTGGEIPFGYRRRLVDQKGVHKEFLKKGKLKALRLDHVILAPGPPEDVATVRRIFRLYVDGAYSPRQIARLLNGKGVSAGDRPSWTSNRVLYMLSNAKYIGTAIFNQHSGKLRSRMARNPRDKWIVVPNAFPGLISRELFDAAQRRMIERAHTVDHQDLLSQLRRLHDEHGRLSVAILRTPFKDYYQMVHKRFGGLRAASEMIGYSPERAKRDAGRIERRQSHEMRLTGHIISAMSENGCVVKQCRKPKVLVIDQAIVAVRCLAAYSVPSHRQTIWRSNSRKRGAATTVVVGRLDRSGEKILDYLVLPRDVAATPFIINGQFPLRLLPYRRATFADVSATLQGIVRAGRSGGARSRSSRLPSHFRYVRRKVETSAPAKIAARYAVMELKDSG